MCAVLSIWLVGCFGFRTIVRKIRYASNIWEPYTQSDISKVEAVQLRAAKFVTGYYR